MNLARALALFAAFPLLSGSAAFAQAAPEEARAALQEPKTSPEEPKAVPQDAKAAPQDSKSPAEDPKEFPIPVPVPAPSGLTLAWRPMILTVRLDDGRGSRFGSDKFQPLRGLARYTLMAKEGTPFFGRFELEGGQFQTDVQNTFVGSNGYDFTGRVLGGAAQRLAPGVLFIASIGAISRYTHGAANGGSPTLGIFGVLANAEIEWRIYPIITLSVFGEAAVAPFPYGADRNLGDLSDASEVRGRIQLSFDVARDTSIEVGYDFTRWHSTFVSSTILNNPLDQALVLEAREYAFTLGVRLRL